MLPPGFGSDPSARTSEQTADLTDFQQAFKRHTQVNSQSTENSNKSFNVNEATMKPTS